MGVELVCNFTNELYHYGVKGMKWGVRRTPEQLGHKKRSNRPYRSPKKTMVEKSIRKKQMLAEEILGRSLTKSQVAPRNRDSGKTSLKKGSRVQHITGVTFDSIKPGQLYVTADKKDNAGYQAFLSMNLKSKGFTPATVIADLKTDLKAPSSKDQYNIFKKFLKNNEKLVKEDVAVFLKEKGKKDSVPDNPKDLYEHFMNSVERSSESQKRFYKMLKDSGYNAVLDEHDVTGSWMQGQKPLIIMDAMSTLGNVKVSELSNKDIERALDEWLKEN